MERYADIQKKFNEVIEYSQGICEAKTDGLFKQWAANKAHFIDKWGGLTVELPEEIVLDRPEEDKRILYQDYVDDAVFHSDKQKELRHFFNSQTEEGFYQNKVVSAFDEDGIKIPAGMKLSKSLKFFFEDKKMLDKFQTRMSRLIQDCKITGKMVMSVHPLDFLSSSETAHNWHSCHALDGEHRAGNLSYMMDKHTFMVYLKADKDYKLPNFPFEWNSKKWRMLLYVREDGKVIVRGRQYPFSNNTAVNIITNEFLAKYFDLTNFTGWTNVENNIRQIMKDEIGSLQYNDCLNSPNYQPFAIYDKAIEDSLYERNNPMKMLIGDGVECLECGCNMISYSSSMSCDECAGYHYCDNCGEPGYEDEMYYLEDMCVCECCWDELAIFCENCNESYNHYETDMTWDEESECYYCSDCYEILLEERRREKEETYEGEL